MNLKRATCTACAIFLSGLGSQEAQANRSDEQGYVNTHDRLAWKSCQQIESQDTRLACFDRWAQQQQTAKTTSRSNAPPKEETRAEVLLPREASTITGDSCRDKQYSDLSRFWELEASSNCGTFSLRGYRPLNFSLSTATSRPDIQASHGGEGSNYQANEARISLSLRTKLAQNLLTDNDSAKQDSLWFGYSQQSTWQLFNEEISRPFRSTDHEPEIMYVYPTDFSFLGGARLRYTGIGVVHQSNGESQPLSRSWNRVYLMGGTEFDNNFQITGRLWHRIREDAETDDNPNIADYIGRAEFSGRWKYDQDNTFDATLRSNLRSSGRGSLRLEWFKAIGDPESSNLRFHTQLFHGYGDTLLDYNRTRTVLSIGLSLEGF